MLQFLKNLDIDIFTEDLLQKIKVVIFTNDESMTEAQVKQNFDKGHGGKKKKYNWMKNHKFGSLQVITDQQEFANAIMANYDEKNQFNADYAIDIKSKRE